MNLDESPVDSTKAARRRKAPRVSADPMVLRGTMGEAALNPWRQAARAAWIADRAGRARAAREDAFPGVDRSRWPTCCGGCRRAAHESGSIGGRASLSPPREPLPWRISRGMSPTRRPAQENGSSAESLHRGVASAPLGKRRRFPADLAAIARQEVLERIESGQSSIGVRRPARHMSTGRSRSSRAASDLDGGRRMAKAVHPLIREHSADEGWKRVLRTRLRVRARALASGSDRGDSPRLCVISTRRSNRQMGPQSHRELAPSPARAGCVESTRSVGARANRGCAHELF